MKRTIIGILLTASLISGCSTFQISPRKDIVMYCFDKACKIKYEKEPEGVDYWKSPLKTKKDKKGDCEDKAFYLEYLLKREGIECKTILGLMNYFALENRKNGRIDFHGWIEHKVNDTVYILDPTTRKIHIKYDVPLNYIDFHILKDIEKNKEIREDYERLDQKIKRYYKDYFYLF